MSEICDCNGRSRTTASAWHRDLRRGQDLPTIMIYILIAGIIIGTYYFAFGPGLLYAQNFICMRRLALIDQAIQQWSIHRQITSSTQFASEVAEPAFDDELSGFLGGYRVAWDTPSASVEDDLTLTCPDDEGSFVRPAGFETGLDSPAPPECTMPVARSQADETFWSRFAAGRKFHSLRARPDSPSE